VWMSGSWASGESAGPDPLPGEGPKPPWPCRLDRTGREHAFHGLGLVDLTQWDPEPDAPAPVKEERFAPALNQLCSSELPYQQSNQYAHWILEACQRFGVDPFLLASLVFQESRCALVKTRSTMAVGLLGIDAAMHAPFLHDGRYSYWVKEGKEWLPRQVDVSANLTSLQGLRQDKANIFFAAALMHAFQQQCPDIDAACQSVPHRHYVSHMLWGDRVLETDGEDRVLRTRRAIIEYYEAATPASRARFRSVELYCPLDGCPRKVTGVLGDVREAGKRAHKGIDFVSTRGEPVRAIADGWVVYAGVDAPGAGARKVTLDKSGSIRKNSMGPGGLFVQIQHKDNLVSEYMHLLNYIVQNGQWVKAGQIIGHVGDTGIKIDTPHLHFQMREGGEIIDPMVHLRPYLVSPRATYRGRLVAAAMPGRWREARLRQRAEAAGRRERDEQDSPATDGDSGNSADTPATRPSSAAGTTTEANDSN
jgi:murein DD-endopeptidase MepM/ murein hydrolase activator NlpD